MTVPTASTDAALRIVRGESAVPHDVLGAHPITLDGVEGVAIRAFQPNAASIAVVFGEQRWPMTRDEHGLFVLFLSDRAAPMAYRLEITFGDDRVVLCDDPYRFPPTLGEMDLHLFNEGRHLRLWEKLGAHGCEIDGVAGTSFAVWAPNATRVSVIGAFNDWDGRAHQMRRLGGSGVFEVFVPGVGAETLYKFEIRSPSGALRVKTDPYAFKMEPGPGHASIVQARGTYGWNDGAWLAQRADADPLREPMLVYEVHLGSHGVYARRVAARARASVWWIVGLSGGRLFRADIASWVAR
jgi:1,4-alpha-glucan branching enzyme